MIVGTAGHIDHGKTTLVRALTGIDTDRLPEEKARGISIELGYAFLDVPGDGRRRRIGFIDVPGHERLVHTMIAGATGIDFGLLLVAADDGVMPQTREHLAVLSLLGIRRGAVAITKIDRVDARRIAEVRNEIAVLLAHTALADAPVLPISSVSGEGIEPLRALLFEVSRDGMEPDAANDDGSAFRLAIDRAFTLNGIGTVVTGSVHAGQVRVGDELALVPSSKQGGIRARVRSLHAQDRAVEVARAGERCAIALVGIAKDQISRGQWVVDPRVELATDRLDATLTLWPGEAKALRSGMQVHVHVGAAAVLGGVTVLSVADAPEAAQSVAPGQSALVQLTLRTPIGAWRGDGVVLRDASASRTIAGGAVLDPFAPTRYRRTAQRLAELSAVSQAGSDCRLNALIDVAPFGVPLSRWSRAEGLIAPTPASWPDGVLTATDTRSGWWVIGAAHGRTAAESTLAALRTFHLRNPEMPGPDSARLRRLAAPRMPEALWRSLIASLQRAGRLQSRGAFVCLPDHAEQLSAVDVRLSQKIAPALAACSFEGRWARDLARDAGENEGMVRHTLARLAQRGELHQVVKDLYYPSGVMSRLAAIVRATATATDTDAVTAGSFRDAAGLGRKRAIQLLEYFDRMGLLRRVGDTHRIRGDSDLFRQAGP